MFVAYAALYAKDLQSKIRHGGGQGKWDKKFIRIRPKL
jgi:hypothetical protein